MISMPMARMIGRGSLSMIFLLVPDSWMPLRCITKVTGALCRSAPLKPLSAWPEIHPASPQWQMTQLPAPWRAFTPTAWPTAAGTMTPRRPPFSSVPPGTHETWPAMSSPRRKVLMTCLVSRKPSAASAP